MLNIYTCAFFGHRDFYTHLKCEEKLAVIVKDLITKNEYVDFLVGRNGEFDQFVSSTILHTRRECFQGNSSLICVLPYVTTEYLNNQQSFEDYYDEIRMCEKSSMAHFKAAIQIRNREMVDCADLIICYIERDSGGAYQTIQYAKRQKKRIINLAIDDERGWA